LPIDHHLENDESTRGSVEDGPQTATPAVDALTRWRGACRNPERDILIGRESRERLIEPPIDKVDDGSDGDGKRRRARRRDHSHCVAVATVLNRQAGQRRRSLLTGRHSGAADQDGGTGDLGGEQARR
jgi:hypothetical protein